MCFRHSDLLKSCLSVIQSASIRMQMGRWRHNSMHSHFLQRKKGDLHGYHWGHVLSSEYWSAVQQVMWQAHLRTECEQEQIWLCPQLGSSLAKFLHLVQAEHDEIELSWECSLEAGCVAAVHGLTLPALNLLKRARYDLLPAEFAVTLVLGLMLHCWKRSAQDKYFRNCWHVTVLILALGKVKRPGWREALMAVFVKNDKSSGVANKQDILEHVSISAIT